MALLCGTICFLKSTYAGSLTYTGNFYFAARERNIFSRPGLGDDGVVSNHSDTLMTRSYHRSPS